MRLNISSEATRSVNLTICKVPLGSLGMLKVEVVKWLYAGKFTLESLEILLIAFAPKNYELFDLHQFLIGSQPTS